MTNTTRPQITKVLAAEVSKEFRAGSFNKSLALMIKSYTFNRDVASKLRKDLNAAEKLNRDLSDTIAALTKEREFKQGEINCQISKNAALQRKLNDTNAEVNSLNRLNSELSDLVTSEQKKASAIDRQLNLAQRNSRLFQGCASETSKKLRIANEAIAKHKLRQGLLLLSGLSFAVLFVLECVK